jgi:hypothetical protein
MKNKSGDRTRSDCLKSNETNDVPFSSNSGQDFLFAISFNKSMNLSSLAF